MARVTCVFVKVTRHSCFRPTSGMFDTLPCEPGHQGHFLPVCESAFGCGACNTAGRSTLRCCSLGFWLGRPENRGQLAWGPRTSQAETRSPILALRGFLEINSVSAVMLYGEPRGSCPQVLGSRIKHRWCRESREPQAAPQCLGLCSDSHKNTLCTCFSKCNAEKICLPNTNWAGSTRECFQLCTTARPCSPAAAHWIVATRC